MEENYPQFNDEWPETDKTGAASGKKERPLVADIVRVGAGVLLIAGMLYLSGVYDLVRFRETPADIQQPRVQSKTDGPELTVPLNVILLRSAGELGSRRSREDIARLVHNASNIWAQANITLAAEEVHEREMTDDDIFSAFLNPSVFRELPEYREGAVNVILSRHIPGLVNGVAYGGLDTITVAEVTTTFDFRTLAHELGHQLGLGHVPGRGALMSSGVLGTELSIDEITRARTYAERFR